MTGSFQQKALDKYAEMVLQRERKRKERHDVQGTEMHDQLEDFTECLRPTPLNGVKKG